MSSLRPIGFFDSGVGGLSVMKEVRRLLPAESLVYFADSAHCPYGVKPVELIRGRAYAICDFMIGLDVKLIVIASNTTSAAALDAVREKYSVPVIGVEPAVKPAAAATVKGRIGVIATGVTLAGERFESLVKRFGDGLEIFTQACPGLVELVESGRWDDKETEELVKLYLDKLLARDVDTIILGCTHYPFLRAVVEKLAGSGIKVIDSGEAVARQVARVLKKNGLAADIKSTGGESFFTTGDPEHVRPVVRLLWGKQDLVVKREEV
ncbi:glutamate racemase [Pelotomaculum propionicicum]|uniref:glutamate racemase n=1 Tax=Pelotomaculum propionicicum TaxID=258475 RepID=UPI003B766FA7